MCARNVLSKLSFLDLAVLAVGSLGGYAQKCASSSRHGLRRLPCSNGAHFNGGQSPSSPGKDRPVTDFIRYVTISRFTEASGYTEHAIRTKIRDGVWREGQEWVKAPDGRCLIDIVGYNAWVASGSASVSDCSEPCAGIQYQSAAWWIKKQERF